MATPLAGIGPSTTGEARTVDHLDPLEELIRVVNEAQGHDAQDERHLYDPSSATGPSFRKKGTLKNPLTGPRRGNLSTLMAIDYSVVATLGCSCCAGFPRAAHKRALASCGDIRAGHFYVVMESVPCLG
jgi:hypothetical protein